MERIRTTEVGQHIGEQVLVAGWLHAVRRLGGITFLVIRDGWGTAQVVVEDEAALEPLETAGALPESVVEVMGMARAQPQAPGGIEIGEPRIRVVTPVTETPPVTLSKREIKAALPTLLDHAVVANRHPTRRAIFRLAAGAMAGFRATLAARGFTEVQTPKIVASATESGANVFQLDYFGTPAFLAQSPQFYKQIMVGVFERVFEVGPVFRAEPHDTTRHTNEYVSLDAEFGFIENHFTVMRTLREVIAGIFGHLATHYGSELELLGVALPEVHANIPHIHFRDAQTLILERYGTDVRGEPDLSPQDERWLGEWAREEHGSDFLFVTGYPMVKRPFYTHPDAAAPQWSNSFDLLFRGTELVTGGQRLHRYEDYLAALARAGYPVAPFESYLEAFRYGMPPHGGFAIGLERLLMQLTGAPNLRLTTLFPRDLTRLTP
ncbi:MAG TPA: aspartate--tRNA(Asn) ligase [Ardenticatenaceae bacterium]